MPESIVVTRRSRAQLAVEAPAAADAVTIAAALEEDIVFGRLGPSVRLVEDELMLRFGAKRHVVRESLSRLTTMGIVVKAPNRGASVRAFTPQEVEHIYQMREILHREAVRLIMLPPEPALVRRLREVQTKHAEAVARGALRDVQRFNGEFHDLLFGACGNPLLASAIRYHSMLAHAIRSYRHTDPTMMLQARDEHWEMIDAFEKSDRKRLIRLCGEHIIPSKLAYFRTIITPGPEARISWQNPRR